MTSSLVKLKELVSSVDKLYIKLMVKFKQAKIDLILLDDLTYMLQKDGIKLGRLYLFPDKDNIVVELTIRKTLLLNYDETYLSCLMIIKNGLIGSNLLIPKKVVKDKVMQKFNAIPLDKFWFINNK